MKDQDGFVAEQALLAEVDRCCPKCGNYLVGDATADHVLCECMETCKMLVKRSYSDKFFDGYIAKEIQGARRQLNERAENI